MIGGLAGVLGLSGEAEARRSPGVKAAKKKKKTTTSSPGPAGPAGPAGPPGPPGFTSLVRRTSAAVEIPASGYLLLRANCEPGETAVSGGGTTFTDARAYLASSGTDIDMDHWTVEYRRVTGTSGPTAMAIVLCAKL
jgi:hypothetical protein